MSNVIELRPCDIRAAADRERRARAREHFNEVNRSRWPRLRFAARVAAAPFVLTYAIVRLGWEWATH